MVFKHISEPILFQGRKKRSKYFEGWYFKQVSEDLRNSICVIPGISKDKHGSHAFIQTIINQKINSYSKPETHYHKFSMQDFKYNDDPFFIEIGKNKFKRDGIELELSDKLYSLDGKIYFSEFTEIKTNPLSPNIMGFYAYLPLMECYHGIISMSHQLKGSLTFNGEVIDFCCGKGYIEKDWGASFPKEYVWVQSSNFIDSDASIMCSIADIPFLWTSFQGFICNLSFGGEEYRFASYNNSKLIKASRSGNVLDIILMKGSLILEINAVMNDAGTLKAPKNGTMSNEIKEGSDGVISVRLIKKPGEVLYEGTGECCGIELVNNN
jgi:hypothetical protein